MSITLLRSNHQSLTGQSNSSLIQTVVGIGNFDGVHRGHLALINAVNQVAQSTGLCPSILTFDPHPLRFFQGAQGPKLIYALEDRISLLKSLGIQHIFLQQFDQIFSALSPEQFIEEVLIKSLNARHIIVGHDFAFGAKRSGNITTLQVLCEPLGIKVEVIDAQRAEFAQPLEQDDQTLTFRDMNPIFSSTWIRQLISEGQLSTAEWVLKRPYHVRGIVRKGHQRGRTLGFPTANLELSSELCPQPGVYTGWLDWGIEPQLAVVSVGDNPTIDETHTLTHQQRWSVEVHVLNQSGHPTDPSDDEWLELYDLPVILWLSEHLRPMQRFETLEALRLQIALDCEQAQQSLEHKETPSWPHFHQIPHRLID